MPEATAIKLVRAKHPELTTEQAIEAASQVATVITTDHVDKLTGTFHKKLHDETNRKVGILCLCERYDNILLWSHYADCHRGICIEFRTDRPSTYLANAQPVEYRDEYPEFDLYDVVVNQDLRAAAPWILTKASHWSYEREWRVIDFDHGPGAQEFPAECLTSVILGCRITAAGKARVFEWLEAFPHHVTVYQAVESKTNFRLEIERLQTAGQRTGRP